jgi:HSP20 family molecular chaperone IbpA
MAERTVAANRQEKAPGSREETRSQGQYITPPVDIYETAEGLVTIRGKTTHVGSGEPVYREYALVNFFRQFELNDRVDASKISADLKHGVLTLNLPKAEEAKPRTIEVRTA